MSLGIRRGTGILQRSGQGCVEGPTPLISFLYRTRRPYAGVPRGGLGLLKRLFLLIFGDFELDIVFGHSCIVTYATMVSLGRTEERMPTLIRRTSEKHNIYV